MSEGPATLALAGVTLADGTVSDVAVSSVTGRIVAVGPASDDVPVLDGRGYVLVPAGVDPHCHLDKALSARGTPSRPATLVDAIADWGVRWRAADHDDVIARATEAAETMVVKGTTLLRSHVDVGVGGGLTGVRALIEVRDDLRRRGLAELELVALVTPPYTGEDGDANLRLLDEALALGVDVVGGAPHLDADPAAATARLVHAAADSGAALDLHVDETVDPDVFFLRTLVEECRRARPRHVVASHCASLSVQPLDAQRAIAAELAELGIAVLVMPGAGLFTFGWDRPVAPPRGLAPVHLLERAGVDVAAGGDNVQDPFVPGGRFDPFETAALVAMAVHTTPEHGWELCSTRARRALGRPAPGVAAGEPADLVGIRARSLTEAVALASEDRFVVRAGRPVARTTTTTTTTAVGTALDRRPSTDFPIPTRRSP